MLWMLLGAMLALGLLFGYRKWRRSRKGKRFSWIPLWKRFGKLLRQRGDDEDER